MSQPLSLLHVLPSFDLDARGARVARLMTAFGDRARHRLVIADTGRLAARQRIGKGVRYEIAQEAAPLAGKPSFARYEALAKLMRGHDLVLTYDWAAIDAVMARRVFARGLPPVIHHEDGFVDAEAGGLRRDRTIYRRLALSAAHALVVPSRALERIALETWKQPRVRVHRVGNGVATALYAERPDPRALPGFARSERELTIGAVGALLPHKDLPALVRAVGGLSTRFRLVIVGDGPEREAIERAALAMGIDDRVVLTGAVERPYRYMGLFDLLALSSASEQTPTSVIEAMAAGLPVVSPPVGDVAEMVAPENLPFVTEHHGEVRLRDAIQALALDPALRGRVGAANRAKARAEFDEADMIARYGALYAEAAGRPACLG
ncbi:glycosyltransferase family 4 protein [Sphingomonas yunnanensis]|uniref:glycosyltransferase family 4 protein n=1 Tax=Sphingomonas yunnanensis TaxID=310400 RepID=UPI001CA60576|nr:glycosyltransferase family 4 protein [Sphingomonas yunnanensis]MBY9062188.1 glycosyltransferase family 4 protein [Sphingomonas yunnanensis]